MTLQPDARPWPPRVALVALVLWGLVHVVGGASLLITDTVDGLETLGPTVSESVPAEPGEATRGLLRFHSLNIAIGGLAVAALAVTWWRQRLPWQLDVAVAVAAALDVGLVVYFVVPGVLPASQGLAGPLLVAIGAIAAIMARGTHVVVQPS